MGILSLMNPTCKELAERLTRGDYERAPLPVRLGVRWHLFRCELCEKYAKQIAQVAEGYRKSLGAKCSGAEDRKKRLLGKLKKQ